MIWYLYSKWHTGCKNFHAASTFIFWSIWNKKKIEFRKFTNKCKPGVEQNIVSWNLFVWTCFSSRVRFIVHSGRLLFDRVFHIRPVPTGLVCSTNDCILPTEICVKGYYLVHFTSLRYIKTVSDVGSGFHKSLKIFWESCQHSATLSSPMTIHNFTHNTPLSCHFRFTGKFPNLQSVGFVLNLSCCSILPCFTNLNVALYMAYLYWTEQ